jgi:hypothetical protein
MTTAKNYLRILFLCVLNFALTSHAKAQGSFQNLGFEAASVPVVPAGQYGTNQPVGAALPGWNVYVGANQQSMVLHDNSYIGTSALVLLGPGWTNDMVWGGPIIQGSYTVLFEAGSRQGDVSLAQTGGIPADSQSIHFKALHTRDFIVAIDGVPLTIMPLQTSDDYTLFGADISPHAGQTDELRFTALSTPPPPGAWYNFLYLDAIQFSNRPIPEPTPALLLCVGVLALRSLYRIAGAARRATTLRATSNRRGSVSF